MQAIILVGGLGTRLRSVLPDLPKPMAPIHGKPFLAYLLDYLEAQGFTEIIFAVHYKHEIIQNFFGKKYSSLKINYVIEDELRGTGGALLYALTQTKINENVFVLNGDTFVKVDYKNMYSQHQDSESMLTVALRQVDNCARYGCAIVKDNRIISFQEKGIHQAGLINAGVYLIAKNLFDSFSLPKIFSFENDFLQVYLPQIKPCAFITESYFIDIGIPQDYQQAEIYFE